MKIWAASGLSVYSCLVPAVFL